MRDGNISHYHILEKLGGGAMGEVYRAEDTRLKRAVALKFLAADMVADASLRQRFLHEAQAAAALDHSSICTVYEIDERDGEIFLAMAFIDGPTLQKKIEQRPLKLEEAVEIAIQTGEGLEAAHDRGIVHRDIKSSNILLTSRGQAKITDFGLAMLGGRTRLTQAGALVGTPAYMSPEQARGETADARSDIWSLGVVLYEMVSGKLPFGGNTAPAAIFAILHREPEPLTALRSGLPVEMDRIVAKALAKIPAERYQHAADILVDLRSVKKLLESRPLTGTVGLEEAARDSAGRKASPPAIAVLAFTDMSPARDQEYFCDGIAEEILNGLAKIEGLHVASRTSAFRYKGQAIDIGDIGRQLNVDTLLEGSVRKSGNRLRITAQLINVADGFHLWSERYDRTVEDIFAIQDEISEAIVGTLKVTLQPRAEDVPRRRARNAAAYNCYLKGRYCWNRRSPDSLKAAIEHFQEALAEDPGYAAAYAGLADSFVMLGMQTYLSPRESMPRALAAARRAIELDASLAEAHVSLAGALALYEWDWSGALAHLEQAMKLNAEYATAYHWYGVFVCVARGREDDSIRAMRRAQVLDPLSLPIGADFGLLMLFLRRYQEAIEQCRRVLDLDSTFFRPYWYLGRACTQLARWDDAFQALGKARELSQWDPRVEAALGFAYARSGQHAEAGRIVDWLKTTSENRYVSPCETAIIAAGLGDAEMAFAWLDRALLDRSGYHIWLRVDPYFDSLRGDPRYPQFLNRMGLGGP